MRNRTASIICALALNFGGQIIGVSPKEFELLLHVEEQPTSFPLLNSLYQLPGFSFGHDEILTCCERMRRNDEKHCSHMYQIIVLSLRG